MKMTEFAIERSTFSLIAIIVICVAGILAYMNAPKDEDPGFTVRTAVILTGYPGASPERVEQLVSIPIEDEISEIAEIERIRSESRTGVSVVYVDLYDRYDDVESIWDDLRASVSNAEDELPDGVIGPDVDDDFGDVYGTILTVTGNELSYSELEEYADDLSSRISDTPEAADVELFGVQDREVAVEYSPARLSEYGITSFELQELIAAENIVLPAGEVFTDAERITLGTTSSYETIRDIERQLVPLPERQELVFLEDVADISLTYEDPATSYVRYNGDPAIAVAVSLREGGIITELDRDVREIAAEFQQEVPLGVDIDFAAEQALHVEDRVNEFMLNIIQAMVTIMGVMLFAIGVRMGLVVTSLVPVTILTTLFIFPMFDIGLDQVSLASIIIALGMLVDNSIVVAESTMVLTEEGMQPKAAAIRSARELGAPLLVASIIISAAFLPSIRADHEMGEYAGPIFWGVTITLLGSWFFAMTMTPLLSAKYLRSGPSPEEPGVNGEDGPPAPDTSDGAEDGSSVPDSPGDNDNGPPGHGSTPDTPGDGGSGEDPPEKSGASARITELYDRILRFFLRNVLLVIGLLTAGLVAAALAAGLLPRQFFPENDRAVMTAELEYEAGTSLDTTDSMVASLESFYEEELLGAEVTDWSSYIGGGAPRFYLPIDPEPEQNEYAFVIINLADRDDAAEVIRRTNDYLDAEHPEARVTASPLVLGPPVDADIEVRVYGEETDTLHEFADEVRSVVADWEGTFGVRDDWGTPIKELEVDVDSRRAQLAGVTETEVAVSLQTALSGMQVSEYRGTEDTKPIMLRAAGDPDADVPRIESTMVYSQLTGDSVPLAQVADVDLAWTTPTIMRRDGRQTIGIQADLGSEYNAIAQAEQLDAQLAQETADWPAGYGYEIGGEAEATDEATDAILAELPIAGLVIVLLLLAQFNSVRKTFIVLLTIPFGLIGVVFGMIVTGATFGVMTLLGVISLAGIVIKNAVVLLDRIKIEMEENGYAPIDAVIVASHRRVRPILLTTATTIFGLLPLWLAASPLWESMTIAIIFGLAFSTLLTLGFVPAMYALLFQVDRSSV